MSHLNNMSLSTLIIISNKPFLLYLFVSYVLRERQNHGWQNHSSQFPKLEKSEIPRIPHDPDDLYYESHTAHPVFVGHSQSPQTEPPLDIVPSSQKKTCD